jgi:Ca2+ transporting ATPase
VTKYDAEKKTDVDCIANQDVFDKITKQLKVLARSSPEDKYLLVTGLKY